jgi:hypothetical protein
LKADDGASIFLGISVSIVVLTLVPLASAAPFPYDIRTFVPAGSPSVGDVCDMFGCGHTLQMTFLNNANDTVTGIAYFVFHNAAGQTIYLDKTSLSSSGSRSGVATIPLNVPVAKDHISVFVVSQGGVALSNSTAVRA